MSRLREYLTEKNYHKSAFIVKDDTFGLTWKIDYAEFKERLKNAPPPPISIPDYEAKKKYLEKRFSPKNF